MIETIPMSYKYTCDACGKTHIQEHAAGHYTNSTPPKWGMLKHYSAYPQEQSASQSNDGREDWLLCIDCNTRVSTVIGSTLSSLKDPKEPTP